MYYFRLFDGTKLLHFIVFVCIILSFFIYLFVYTFNMICICRILCENYYKKLVFYF